MHYLQRFFRYTDNNVLPYYMAHYCRSSCTIHSMEETVGMGRERAEDILDNCSSGNNILCCYHVCQSGFHTILDTDECRFLWSYIYLI